MSRPLKGWVQPVLMAALAGGLTGLLLGLVVGAWTGRQGPVRELEALRVTQAEAGRLAAQAAARRLQAAQERGDALTRRVRALERLGAARLKERNDALQRATLGRPCLGVDALRVLDGSPGLRVERVPAPTGSAPGANAAAAADSGQLASDRDVGSWALEAGEQYERCRTRLGALIDFHNNELTKKGPHP